LSAAAAFLPRKRHAFGGTAASTAREHGGFEARDRSFRLWKGLRNSVSVRSKDVAVCCENCSPASVRLKKCFVVLPFYIERDQQEAETLPNCALFG
jgi:hypothetical protein